MEAIFLFEELELNYEVKSFRFDDIKKKPFIDINPNGRVPAIEDPNTDLTLWESGAIYQYLIEQYDTDKRLSYTTVKEKNLCNQWLHFQMSGQGPYYGQCGWFQHRKLTLQLIIPPSGVTSECFCLSKLSSLSLAQLSYEFARS